jgi:hypothetical protein
MLNDNSHKGKKIHTRNMEISTYEYDEKHIVVEGKLKEDILIPIYISGKKRQPHTIHHMVIQMFIECSSLTIKDIKVEMPGIPYDECMETTDSLDGVKGLKIAPGFTSKVIKILGENKRCLHLKTLLLAIAPTVMQGYWTFNARKPRGGVVSPDVLDNYLIDTCWVWRKDGSRSKHLMKKID